MQTFLFILVMLFSVFVQSVAGFGGTMLAMPLGILLCGIDLSKPVLTILACVCGISVLITEYKYINWRELFKMVAVMLVGVVGGVLVTGKLHMNFLLIIYALVIIAIGVKSLFFPSKKEAPKFVRYISLGVAGIMQGLFVSGGSFLAVYSVSQIKEKRVFRATINGMWAIVNTIMIITFASSGMLTGEVLKMTLICLLPTLAIIWLGGVITKHIKQSLFLKIIYVILIVSGAVLLITNL